jgi:16S rRNA processing protein RimM
MHGREDRLVIMGRVIGLFGVCGWLKIFSHTDPREGILSYSPWRLRMGAEWRVMDLEAGRRQGKGVLALLRGIAGRDEAGAVLGSDIAVLRSQLPPPEPGEYYWNDLEGLRVQTAAGVLLGSVDHLLETGAHDVLVVKGDRERLIPFVEPEVVERVDLTAGTIVVNWDPDF